MTRPAILAALAGGAAALSAPRVGLDIVTLQAAFIALMSGLGAMLGALLDRWR